MKTFIYLVFLAAVQTIMYIHAQGVFSGSLDYYRFPFINAGIFLGVIYIFYNLCNIIATIIKFSVHPQDEKSANDVLLLGFSFVQILSTVFFIGFLKTGVVRFLHAALLSIPLMVVILFSLNLPSIVIKNYSIKRKFAVIFSFLFIFGLSFSPYLFLKFPVNPSLGIAVAIVSSLLIATFFGFYLFVVDYDKAFIPPSNNGGLAPAGNNNGGAMPTVRAAPAGNVYDWPGGPNNVRAAPAGNVYDWPGGPNNVGAAPAGNVYGWPGGFNDVTPSLRSVSRSTILRKLGAAQGSEAECNVCWDTKDDVVVLADFVESTQASTTNVACKACWSGRINATPDLYDILDLNNKKITEEHDFYPASIMPKGPSQ